MNILTTSAALAVICYTLTNSLLSRRYLHPLLEKIPEIPFLKNFLVDLFKCAYCLAHYLAIPLTLLMFPLNWTILINYLAVIAISQIFILIFIVVKNANSNSTS